MPTKKKKAASKKRTVAAKKSVVKTFAVKKGHLNLWVILTIQLILCAWIAMLHNYVSPLMSLDMVVNKRSIIDLEAYRVFSYSFLPFLVFFVAYWWWHRFVSKTGLTTGKGLKFYLMLSLVVAFVLGVLSGYNAYATSAFVSVFLGLLYLTFKPALLTTLVYVLLHKWIKDAADKLEKI